MTRCCAQCTSNGGSHRSCGGVKLFGVRLTDGSIVKKSASMGNLSYNSATTDSLEGYHSDVIDIADTGRRRPLRKKGVPWSKHEHAQFLNGLDKLGRGNWRGISRIYVPSRTSTQVASHAQKYFIRQSNANEPGKRKRPSLFDSAPEMETNPSQPELFTFPSPTVGTEIGNIMLSSSPAANMSTSQLSLDLSLGQGFTPLPFQLGPPNAYSLMDYGEGTSQNQMHRPEAVVPEEPTTELVGMSQLNLGETGRVQIESSPFSLRILGNP